MYVNNEEWIITAVEAASRLTQTGRGYGLLNALPQAKTTETQVDKTPPSQAQSDHPSEENQQLLDACIGVLANPKRLVRLHYNISDTSVSRSILASSDELPGVWVTLAGSEDPFRLSMRSDPELRFLIGDVLSVGANIRPTRIGCNLSTEAALILMAALDQARRAYLISMLQHIEPVSFFSVEDIKERLTDGSVEDFRWVLPLTEKLLPIPIKDMSVTDDPRTALLELIEAGLIEPVDEAATIFDLTEAGRVLSEGNLHAISRLVLSQSLTLSDESIAHDVLLLIRTPLDLFLIMMSGAEASLTTLLPAELSTLLERLFTAPLGTTEE